MDLSELVVGEFNGPLKGSDRAVLLAPSAGTGRDAPVLVAVADYLAQLGIPSLRFDYPYRVAGRRIPDQPAVLEATTRAAALELSQKTGLGPERLVLGGRSMGGRYASMLVGSTVDPLLALGLLLLSYPLHPAGKPEKLRDAHFSTISVPVLCISGTRDALAPRLALETASKKFSGPKSIHWLDTTDHSYKPLKRSGISPEEVVAEVALVAGNWVANLPIS